MKHRLAAAALLTIATLAGCAAPPAAPGKRALMIVGNDEKQSWNDAGAGVMSAQRPADTVSVVDIGTDPLAPKIVVNLPLDNTIFGPPTNLAITPDEGLALVANSVNVVEEARCPASRCPTRASGSST